MRKRIVSLLMALVMILSLVPTTVFAEDGTTENLGTVHVIVENTTFTEATASGKTPAWTGRKVDTDVSLNADSTMMSCIEAAIEKAGFTADIKDSSYGGKYISGIAGLYEFDGGSGSGWMGTLNDWLTNMGFSNYAVSNGTLRAGDEIRVMYSRNGGKDIGGDFYDMSDTSLTALSFSAGTLSPTFDKGTTEYTLTLPEGTQTFTASASAANKQNQVYLTVGDTSYRRTAAVPAVSGTTLNIRCGDAKEASGDTIPAVVPTNYTIHLLVKGSEPPAPVVPTATVTIRSQAEGVYLHGFAQPVEVASNLAESYGFTDQVTDGVSALDALVKAHEITFKDAFTKETVDEFLAVSDSGFVTKLFGETTSNCGFTINGETPHDGVLKDDSYAPGKKSYTGYTITQATVKNGDVVDFFLYQDSYALDNYPIWERNGAPLSSLTVKPEAKVDITVNGYWIGYYGCVPMAALAENGQIKALEDAQLAWVDAETGTLTDIGNAVVGEDGKVNFTAPAEAGAYYLTAYMPADEIKINYATPVIMSILPVTVSVNAPDLSTGADVTFSGIHSAQVASLKLYTYNNGIKGITNLLNGVEVIDGAYTVPLTPGQYWVEGYDENSERNGGLAVTVDEGHNSFKIQRMYQITVSPSNWVLGKDYTLSVKLTDVEKNERNSELGTTTSGKGQAWEKVYNTCIFVLGDTVEATATPTEKNANFNPATAAKTPTMNDSLSLTCKEFVTITFQVPENSTITVGTLAKYYVYSYIDPVSEETPNVYNLDKNTDYFYRVQNPNGVTYWNYTKWDASSEVEVTAADLHINDDSFNKSTIYRFEKNVYDRAGIYLNINTQGYKNMAVGETFELNSFRNWFAIESISNAKVALPDMHYQVIDVNGNDSDVVTITPDEKNSNVATMTAQHEGTAIVLVTYDAMTHMNGMGNNTIFSAIWPELTGVFIVTVGNDGSSIQTNMVLDRMDADITKDEARQLDAEHDILFYLGSEGASYSFKPEEGCTVTVARSTVGSTMTFNGFTGEGVTAAEDGTVTITGLTSGRHIVKVEKDGKANYQVITARGVSYDLVDAKGNVLTDEEKASIKAGDTVYLQFHDLISPKEKLSGAYNFNFSLYYKGEDGTYFRSDPGSQWGVYDFSGNPVRQLIKITIPKYWDTDTYSLTGAIKQAGWPGVPTHRGITYAKGAEKGFNAPSVSGILSRLPEVSIPVAETKFITGTLIFKGSDGSAIERNKLTVTLTDSDGNVITVNEDGTFKAVAETYTYAITGAGVEYATGTITLKSGGRKTFEITLNTTSSAAWDGVTMTQPEEDENGVYQIATGAELAWFVNASAKANVSGVLTDDIDLSKYVWLDISSNYRVELDGQGHEITDLNAKNGLFKQIGGGSHIQDLTLRGTSAGGGSVTGYASGSGVVIENCFSYVTINSTSNNVGGIVGSVASNATIRNCANYGNITGGSNVGGIIGGFTGSDNTVTGCYNTGVVTATGSNAGGVFGGNGGATIDSCYNTGLVTGGSNVGGIGGMAKGSTWPSITTMTITNCYSTRPISSFGSVDDGSAIITNCYTKKADAYADTLERDSDLGDSYKLICGGYPVLNWQEGTSHTASGDGDVIAPTCTEKGYTTYTCANCGETYKVDRTDAAGHTVPEDGKTRYLLHTTYTCTVCNELITEWINECYAILDLPADGVTAVSTADNDYPWQYNAGSDRIESSNQGENNSTSQTALTFTLTAPMTISFNYGVSSEARYDKFTATLSNGTGDDATVNTVADAISGTVDETYSGELTAGTWTLTLTYTKDEASSSGDDLAYISDLKLSSAKQNIYQETGDAMANKAQANAPKFGSIGGEWMVLGLARSGREVPNVDAYYQNVVAAVQEAIAKPRNDGRLDATKSTENSRLILALTAIGKDPSNVGGYNLFKDLGDMKYVTYQGTNGPAFALLALDSGNYEPYAGGDVTREALITKLVELQMSSGGWYISDSNKVADIDMTAMVVQALAPYYDTNESAKTSVDKALAWLLNQQNSDGSFGSTSETNAQIVVMLCALNRDPSSDSQFTKDGKSPLDVLCSYYDSNGNFKHSLTGSTTEHSPQMTNEQAFYALVAFNRLKNGQTFLYDMTDVVKSCDTHSFGDWTVTTPATCTTDGVETRVCSVCDTVETQVIKATGHHFGNWTVAKEATCLETGLSTRICPDCDTVETLTIDAKIHQFGEWIVSTPATCTEDGTESRICSLCDTEDTRTIDALGHEFTEWTTAKAATCTEKGSETRSCTRDGCTTVETREINALGHDFGEWTVAKAATCTTDGESVSHCKREGCNETQTMVIKALGHNPGKDFYMDKDNHWKICERCKAEVEKTAHSYVGDQQCVCGYRKDNTRIVVKDAVTVPETLAENEKLNTPEKIETELTTRIVAKDRKFTADNTVVMDVVLQVLDDDGNWVDAKPEDFTATGTITVLLPYPVGIDSSNYTKYDFMVSHMFTSDVNGKTPGDVEFPAFTKTKDGLLVTLTGLSPVAISYVVHVDDSGNQGNGGHYNGGHRGNGSSGSSGTTKPADDVKSSNTGDNSQMALWMGSVMLSAAALVVLTRKRKHSAK